MTGLAGGLADNGGLSGSVVSSSSLVWATGVPYGPPGSGLPCMVDVGGVLYVATTTFTSGASFGADGANWAPLSSAELGYAQITSSSAIITSTTPTVATGLSTTVTVGSRPLRISAFAYGIAVNNNIAFVARAGIFEDGVQVAQFDYYSAAVQFADVGMNMAARRNPTAGSHTYDVRVWSDGTHGAFLNASATSPAHIQVMQV